MAKVSQDEIKWILSMDAKGIQAEVSKLAGSTKIMTSENEKLKRELKATEKIMNQSARAMQRMEESGKQNTVQYRRAAESYNSASREVKDFKTQINQNSQTIDANDEKIKELNKSMDINDMTMNQLRQRARELGKQLNSTSKAASPEAYASLQKEQAALQGRMTQLRNSGQGLMGTMGAIPGPVGMAANSLRGLGTAMKALIANPVGIVIMAIAIAFMAFKKAISSSEEASVKFQMILAPFKALMDALLYVLQKTVIAFLDLAAALIKWTSKALEFLPFVGKEMEKINQKSRDAIQLERDKLALKVRERESLVTNAQKESEIAKLRYEAKQRDIYTNEEIIQKLARAQELEKAISVEKIEQAKESLRLLQIEADRADNNEEINNQLAQQTALIINLEAEYYTSIRRMESESYTRRKEQADQARSAAKEALDKKIADIEASLQQETILLKSKLAQNEILEDEYNSKLEAKQLEALQRKLEVAGLERSQRLQIEEQILDFKVKAMEQEREFEREREELAIAWGERFLQENEQELQSIETKYNKEFEKLIESHEKEAITLEEFLDYKEQLFLERDKELAEKRRTQRESDAEKELVQLMFEQEQEKFAIKKAYADNIISKEEYENSLLSIEDRYAALSLNIQNITAEQRMAIQDKLLDKTIQAEEKLTAKQQDETQKRGQMYAQFSEQIGATLGGFIASNDDIVKSSLKNILNMALDALKVQVQLAIAGATAQSLAQPDSVATFGAAGFARAAIMVGLIEGAFAAVKGVVNNALSGSSSSNTSANVSDGDATGNRVVRGKQAGGYIDVNREQDGKKYTAMLKPKKRGYVTKPTVIVGDGPEGKSKEWVASNDALQNPSIAPIIEMLDESQRAGTIRTIDINQIMRNRMAGFEGGGFIDRSNQNSHPAPDLHKDLQIIGSPENIKLMRAVRDLLQDLKTNGVKAPIVLSELQAKQKLQETSQKIGSK